MAQTGYTPIQLYRTTTSGAAPLAANLQQGELAININDADMALYAENQSGTVKRLMNNPAGLKYPTVDGTVNYLLKTDGAGNLSWTAPGGTGTVISVAGTGTVNGISLSGTVTSSGSLTLSGTLSGVSLTSQVSGTLPVSNGGTGSTSTTYCSLATNVTGTLPVANGGTGTTTPALVAGTNVTISGTWPNQTINASGGTSLTGFTSVWDTALGVNALISITGNTYSTATGVGALRYNTTGTQNSACGVEALRQNTTGTNNVANGASALQENTTGNGNTACGMQAQYINTTGSSNVALGQNAFFYNTTGSYNVGIGASVASSSATVSNEVNIYNGTVTARFQGSASSWSFVSDVRDKTNIVDLELGLNFINKLQPRKFEWDLRHTDVDKGKAASGFIAQEVLSVLEQEDALFTGLVDTNDSEKYMLAQTGLIPMLVNAIKELTTRLEILEGKLK